MSIHHLLMVALALDGASGSNDRRHSLENSATFSHLSVLHDLLILNQELKVSCLLNFSPRTSEIPLFVKVGHFAEQWAFSLFFLFSKGRPIREGLFFLFDHWHTYFLH